MLNKKYHIYILPHGRRIETRPCRSLMESLMDQSVFLRPDCGGKGTFRKCRVKKISDNGNHELINSCMYLVSEDIKIELPKSSMLSSHIISKAPVSLPTTFNDKFNDIDVKDCYGIAVDLGTTTIALYLCNIARGKNFSLLAVKNPQVLYWDDVMSRIGAIGQEEKNLGYLQKLVVRTIEWGIKKLLVSFDLEENIASQMVVVGKGDGGLQSFSYIKIRDRYYFQYHELVLQPQVDSRGLY